MTLRDATSRGLEGGAIAGIVIGVMVAFILMIVIMFFIFRRTRQSETDMELNQFDHLELFDVTVGDSIGG